MKAALAVDQASQALRGKVVEGLGRDRGVERLKRLEAARLDQQRVHLRAREDLARHRRFPREASAERRRRAAQRRSRLDDELGGDVGVPARAQHPADLRGRAGDRRRRAEVLDRRQAVDRVERAVGEVEREGVHIAQLERRERVVAVRREPGRRGEDLLRRLAGGEAAAAVGVDADQPPDARRQPEHDRLLARADREHAPLARERADVVEEEGQHYRLPGLAVELPAQV